MEILVQIKVNIKKVAGAGRVTWCESQWPHLDSPYKAISDEVATVAQPTDPSFLRSLFQSLIQDCDNDRLNGYCHYIL